MKTTKTLRGLVAGSLLLGSSMLAAPLTLAQDDDDMYGSWLYAGTLEDLANAEVVDDIGELERDDDDQEELWNVLGNGQDMPDELYTEDDDLDDTMPLDDLTSESHLIVVHEDDDRDSPILAVGVIQGDVDDNQGILIQLDEYEDSGFEGRSWIGPDRDDDDDDDDGDDLDVLVGLYPAGSVEPLGTPEPTPRG